MRYAAIKKIEIENGRGIGTSLFVQGCPIHCKGCHNPETWPMFGGDPFTAEVEKEWFDYIETHPYIERVSILGGEPLAPYNFGYVLDLLCKIKTRFPDKTIWLYTGYERDKIKIAFYALCDYIVAGPYIEELRDISLAFMGSSNQEIIYCREVIDNV